MRTVFMRQLSCARIPSCKLCGQLEPSINTESLAANRMEDESIFESTSSVHVNMADFRLAGVFRFLPCRRRDVSKNCLGMSTKMLVRGGLDCFMMHEVMAMTENSTGEDVCGVFVRAFVLL